MLEVFPSAEKLRLTGITVSLEATSDRNILGKNVIPLSQNASDNFAPPVILSGYFFTCGSILDLDASLSLLQRHSRFGDKFISNQR